MTQALDVSPLRQFWDRDIEPDRRGRVIHPEDAAYLPEVLPPLLDAGMRIPPAPVTGKLLGARVFLLALNPGHTPEDDKRAASSEGQRWWRRMRSGSEEYERSGNGWFQRKLEWLAPWSELAPYTVKLNRFAYSSNRATAPVKSALRKLPSSRLMGEWAADVLFSAARRGECAVLVTRAHGEWNLTVNRDEGACLFCSFTPVSSLPRHEDRPRMRRAVQELLNLQSQPEP
jgi:hypothetical protein